MNIYLIVKTVHIITATILFGTGLGIAFFMFRTRYTNDLAEKFFALRTTVLADYMFTAPAGVLQPLTGAWLVTHGGFVWTDTWLLGTYALYVLAAACWLPVVWIQIALKRMVADSRLSCTPLPARYHRLFGIWCMLGWPAFIALIVIFYLMAAKPAWA